MAAGQRVSRFILVFAVMLALWLLLSGKFDAFHISWGVLTALGVAFLSSKRTPGTPFPLIRFLIFVPWLLWQIFISNLRVAKAVLSPGLPIQPRVLRKPSKLNDPRALTLLGCSITLTPGTLTININDDHMLIHAVDDGSRDDIEAETMANKVAGIFGEDVGEMTGVFACVLAGLVLLMLPYTVRIIIGPTVFDRILGLNGIGTKVPVALVVVGLLYDRVDMFVDLAMALFLLNLFTTLLVAKYVREKGGAAG